MLFTYDLKKKKQLARFDLNDTKFVLVISTDT